jgi:signal peptidase I
MPADSMAPTLRAGDKFWVEMQAYHGRLPQRGDIVIFHAPAIALQLLGQHADPHHPTDDVKRVIGLPGDRLHIVADQGVYLNGKLLNEPYVKALPNYNCPLDASGDPAINIPEVCRQIARHLRGKDLVIPANYLFVLGDNRNESHDSHVWGLLPRSALVGKAISIYSPPDHRKSLK